MKPHKWAKEIKAWADGAEIEYKNTIDGVWDDLKICSPVWGDDRIEYRIKPQPKEPQYLYLFVNNNHNLHARNERHGFYHLGEYMGKIKLEDE